MFEWLAGLPATRGRVAVIGAWDRVAEIAACGRGGVFVNAGLEPITVPPLTPEQALLNRIKAESFPPWPGEPADAVTFYAALEYVRAHQPRALWLTFGETDEWAHARRYDRTLLSAQRTDAFIAALWHELQATPATRGTTTLIVAGDHGRGRTGTDWTDHGKDVPGAAEVWIAALGPLTAGARRTPRPRARHPEPGRRHRRRRPRRALRRRRAPRRPADPRRHRSGAQVRFQCLAWDVRRPRRGASMKVLPAVACAAALVATSLPAEPPSWTRLGFDGGDVRALVADPGDPATLLAGLAVGGVYRSTDGAATWRAVNGGLPADLGEVRALAVDPSDSAVVYAATARAVYRSADAGASWVLAGGAANWDVRALAVAAAPVSTLFVACGSAGLATSVAGGPLVVRDLGVPEVVGVAVDPGDAWKAYAGTCGQGLLRSTDGGVTWEPRGHRPPACLSGLSLGADSTRIFAATDRGVVRSSDGGNTWLFEQACLECVVAHAVAPDPAGGGRVLAGRTVWSAAGHPGVPLDGVFASADGGSRIRPLLAFRHTGNRTRAIVFDANEPSVVYAATDGKGVLKSLDGGRHWRPANRGLAATGARVIVPDAETPGIVLAGTDGGAVLRTRDGGETWETLHDGVESAGVVALVADPATPGTLLAGTAGSGVLRSDDGGATWSPSNAGLDLLWLADLAADPFEEGRLIAPARLIELIGGAILFYESTDGGATGLSSRTLVRVDCGPRLRPVHPGPGAVRLWVRPARERRRRQVVPRRRGRSAGSGRRSRLRPIARRPRLRLRHRRRLAQRRRRIDVAPDRFRHRSGRTGRRNRSAPWL